MEFMKFTAGINDKGRRLDKIIRKMIPESKISSLYSSIRKGLIRVNEKKCDISLKINEGDVISIAAFLITNAHKPEENSNFEPQIKFQTVFSNDFIRIINKPYDISVHSENGLASAVEKIYNSEQHEKSLSFKTGPLHRLDRKTTGLLAFSNNLQGAEWFTKAISEKKIQKYYIGICQGRLEKPEHWNDYIVQDHAQSSFYKMKVSLKDTDEKNLASTICTPLSYGTYKTKPVTLCQFQILTGKKHQIRLQSSFHGIPLLGDTAYGADKVNSFQDLYLHSYKLFIPDNNPIELPVEITADLPENFTKFLKVSLINWDYRLIIN